MLEKTIEVKVMKGVKLAGGIAIKMVGFVTGLPDRLVLMPGARIWFIEFKRPGGELRPRQVIMIKFLRSLGFTVLVIDSMEGANEFLRKL